MVSEILKRNHYSGTVIQKCIKDIKIKMVVLQSNKKNDYSSSKNKNQIKNYFYFFRMIVSSTNKKATRINKSNLHFRK